MHDCALAHAVMAGTSPWTSARPCSQRWCCPGPCSCTPRGECCTRLHASAGGWLVSAPQDMNNSGTLVPPIVVRHCLHWRHLERHTACPRQSLEAGHAYFGWW